MQGSEYNTQGRRKVHSGSERGAQGLRPTVPAATMPPKYSKAQILYFHEHSVTKLGKSSEYYDSTSGLWIHLNDLLKLGIGTNISGAGKLHILASKLRTCNDIYKDPLGLKALDLLQAPGDSSLNWEMFQQYLPNLRDIALSAQQPS